MANMKIGVLGSGEVGEVLADGFLKHGYEVIRGSRDPQKLNDWKSKAGGKASVGTFQDTAKQGQILVLAVKGAAAEDVIKLCGIENLKDKTILDTTNPIAESAPVNGVLSYFTDTNMSLMERLQKLAPAAHFVKAFNSVGTSAMVNPQFKAGKPTMFICGSNDGAKKRATEILSQFGWETADLGAIEAARAIEPLCRLWCIPGFTKNQWTHAFKLLQ